MKLEYNPVIVSDISHSLRLLRAAKSNALQSHGKPNGQAQQMITSIKKYNANRCFQHNAGSCSKKEHTSIKMKKRLANPKQPISKYFDNKRVDLLFIFRPGEKQLTD